MSVCVCVYIYVSVYVCLRDGVGIVNVYVCECLRDEDILCVCGCLRDEDIACVCLTERWRQSVCCEDLCFEGWRHLVGRERNRDRMCLPIANSHQQRD